MIPMIFNEVEYSQSFEPQSLGRYGNPTILFLNKQIHLIDPSYCYLNHMFNYLTRQR